MHSKRYLSWLIRLGWVKPLIKGAKKPWYERWGWQVGWDGAGMGVFGRTIRIKRLAIKFGSYDFKKKPHKQVLIPIEDR